MPNHTFTGAGRLSDLDQYGSTITQQGNSGILLRIGAVGFANIGTAILIQVKTETGGRHTIREITSLAELKDNSLILNQPASEIDIEVRGAANLYIEFKEFRDEESQR